MLQVKNICKEYKTGSLVQKALDDVSLNLRDNEFVAILGPSGSGKTTLLNIIGGLDCYDSGNLIINDISTKDYKDRDWDSYRNHTIGFVFQSYNLIPHQTILANVELALIISGISSKERKKRAMKALEEVGLEKQAHKKPSQLSGGQMQRVAIARALVNNPNIVLADEPTGALDSDTSVQVMELLKKVAKDRLVVMVTHNPELAETYATRIITLRDGKICSDSDPYNQNEEQEKLEHKNMGKTSMSLFTSLGLSFNNLKTKKGRTFLTSFAGSIGIIGIALILALSNGVNSYIKSIETDTLSEYPLQIQKTGFDMSSMMVSASADSEEVKTKGKVGVTNTLNNMFSSINTNDLTSLKKYFESDECNINEYAKSIEYTYNIAPKIYSSNLENLKQLNPNKSFSSLGLGSDVNTNNIMSSMMSTDVFFQIPKDTSLFETQYDVKAGHWPKKYNECVLVLTKNGNISDMLLYTLGLRDYNELEKMIEQFSKEEKVDTNASEEEYSYDDILNIKFKVINNYECYEYDEEFNVWHDKSEDTEYMKQIVEKSEDLNIVGIVRPKADVNAQMLNNGIYYQTTLVDHIIDNSKTSKIVQDQLEHPDINVFTGKSFEEKSENSGFDMDSLINIDEKALTSAFKFDESKLKIDFSNLGTSVDTSSMPNIDFKEIINQIDFSLSDKDIENITKEIGKNYKEYIKSHPEEDISKINSQFTEYLKSQEAKAILQKEIMQIIITNGNTTITDEQMQKIMDELIKGYQEYANKNNYIGISDIQKYIMKYLQSQELKNALTNSMIKIIEEKKLEEQISKIMQKYIQQIMNQISGNMEKELTESMKQLSKNMEKAISFDEKTFANAFNIKMDEKEMSELFTSLMPKEQTTYEGNLKKLGYADFDNPDVISIFPKDFESNKKIINLLDEYNSKMEQENQKEKIISYTDLVGTLMSSITMIVDVISYVLIAFVAISLVVSSIMIGVITYISVLERKKEIGILRAMGASKRNISQVFNAETFIVGLLSGILGIGTSIFLLIPINSIIHMIAQNVSVTAKLPIGAAIILIVLSVILTLIGGIIPSKKAAKEDPVLALRTE